MRRYVLSLLIPLIFSGCSGYAIKGDSKSAVLENIGIRKIFIMPLRNESYKAGVENTVYNALVREFSARGAIQIIQDKTKADAIIQGVIHTASYVPAGYSTANSLPPVGTAPNNVIVASDYNATLACSFALLRINRKIYDPDKNEIVPENSYDWFDLPPPDDPEVIKRIALIERDEKCAELKQQIKDENKPKKDVKLKQPLETLWSARFSRTDTFQANNQLGVLGRTSELINDSEFERALKDMAESMMPDVHVALLERF